MATYSIEHDRITLSPLDVRILIALLAGQESAYGIAQQCERDDCSSGTKRIVGNTYKSLTALAEMMLVNAIESHSEDIRRKYIYRITSLGRMLVKQNIVSQASFIAIAQERLEYTAHQKNSL